MFRTWSSYRRFLSVKAREQDRDQHGRFSNSSDATLAAVSDIDQASAPDDDADSQTTPTMEPVDLGPDTAQVPGSEQPLQRKISGMLAGLRPNHSTVLDVLVGLLSAYALIKLWCTVSCLITRTHHVTLTDIVLIPHQQSASYGQVHTTRYECTRSWPFSTYHCYEHYRATAETKRGHRQYRPSGVSARSTGPAMITTTQHQATGNPTVSNCVMVVMVRAKANKKPTSFQAVRRTAQTIVRHSARGAISHAVPGPSIVRAPTADEPRTSSRGYRAAADVIETIERHEAKGCVTPGVTVRASQSGTASKSNPK